MGVLVDDGFKCGRSTGILVNNDGWQWGCSLSLTMGGQKVGGGGLSCLCLCLPLQGLGMCCLSYLHLQRLILCCLFLLVENDVAVLQHHPPVDIFHPSWLCLRTVMLVCLSVVLCGCAALRETINKSCVTSASCSRGHALWRSIPL